MNTSYLTQKKKGTLMSKIRFISGVTLVIGLFLSPIALYTAHAATGGPKDSVITLQSPVLDATNTSDPTSNQQMADGWVAKGWFGSGLVFQVSFAPVGSTINLTYNVKDKNGRPLAYTAVNLRINKGYSESASIVQVDGVKTKGIDRPPFDQANVIHRTDAFGNVSFALKSLDLDSSAEPQPDSFSSKPIFSDDKLDRLHSQMLPEVNSEPADHSVITEFHYYLPKAQTVIQSTKPSILLISPRLDSTNSVTDPARGLKQAYAPLGGDLVVVYRVIGDDGKTAVPNKSLTLKVNGGKSTLQAITDAFGFAVFTVKNTDSKPNSAPLSASAAMPSASTAFSTFVPEISGATPTLTDAIEFHYYRGIFAYAEKSGKEFVVSVVVDGAAGKSASISVSGAKKSTVKISAARQVIPIKVSAGPKVVTVTIDGKIYTAKVVAK